MTSERWERTKQLLEDALRLAPEKRAVFLDSACADDAALRGEVESLIAAHEEAGSQFLGAAAPRVLDISTEFSSAPSRVGESVGPYKIIEEIGRGGMGVVYKAEDPRLNRFVALKFLPEDVARNPQALARFRREAQAASALNHPNICTIYDIGQHGTTEYMVMELLEGGTLASRLYKGALPAERVMQYGIEVADALDAAHRRGIVHRDLKPGNIFVTTRGECKVLDFGLAKLGERTAHPDAPTVASPRPETLTNPGSAMGTVSYMSPEQARGEELDARTDIFSLGAVLYEMATGKMAFPGRTSAIVFKAILDEDPEAPSRTNPLTPVQLDEIVSKALEKDKDLRYQSAADMRADLKRLQRNTEGSRSDRLQLAVVPSPTFFTQVKWLLLSLAIAAALLGTMLVTWRRKPTDGDQLIQRQLTARTSDSPIFGATISKDGRYVAYDDKDGISIQEIDSGETHKLSGTAGLHVMDWYPDGLQLLVTDDKDLWTLFAFTSEKRKLAPQVDGAGLSKDGSQILLLRQGDPGLWIMPGAGGEPKLEFTLGEDEIVLNADWSPDGRAVAYFVRRLGTYQDSLVVRSLLNGNARVLLTDRHFSGSLLWHPDGRIFFGIYKDNGIDADLWAISADPGDARATEPSRVTNTIGSGVRELSVSADGKRMAITSTRSPDSILVAELSGENGKFEQPLRLTNDSWDNRPEAWAPDSRTLFFTSSRRNISIYKTLVSPDSGELVAGGMDYSGAAVTPDADWLITIADQEKPDRRKLLRIPVTGGTPETVLVPAGRARVQCAVSGDRICVLAEAVGKLEVFSSLDPQRGRLAELARISTLGEDSLVWSLSFDGTKIAVSEVGSDSLRVLDLHSQQLREIHTSPRQDGIRSVAWSAAGDALFLSVVGSKSHLVQVDLRGRARTLLDANLFWNSFPHPSPDGKQMALAKPKPESNVILLEHF